MPPKATRAEMSASKEGDFESVLVKRALPLENSNKLKKKVCIFSSSTCNKRLKMDVNCL